MSATLVSLSTLAHPIYEAGILHAIRDAVIGVLVIVFLLGAVVGFALARLIYRRRSSPTFGQSTEPVQRRPRR